MRYIGTYLIFKNQRIRLMCREINKKKNRGCGEFIFQKLTKIWMTNSQNKISIHRYHINTLYELWTHQELGTDSSKLGLLLLWSLIRGQNLHHQSNLSCAPNYHPPGNPDYVLQGSDHQADRGFS